MRTVLITSAFRCFNKYLPKTKQIMLLAVLIEMKSDFVSPICSRVTHITGAVATAAAAADVAFDP